MPQVEKTKLPTKKVFFDIIIVQTHLLEPNDLLQAMGQINGPMHYLFDTCSLHNFFDDHLV